jgi:CheY-like chemotaxis protein/anti-sigma regulatory factor (Ser/Thr protein kinase)
VQHQARLVDDLLDTSRISRGRIELQPERLDLVRLIHDAAEDYRSPLEETGLTLSMALPAEAIWVDGDRTRLCQVLGNLLNNAMKFTEPGGTVTVAVALQAEGSGVAVRVRDTGIGIDPEILPRLFESFIQGDRSLDRSRGGLGLGLALVKGLVELHRGEVHVHSEGPGKGAEFAFLLPAVAGAPSQKERPLERHAAMPQHPRRILVVDDNRDAAETLRDLLELSGYEVATAHSGPAGLEAAHRFRPDAVLCDIGLPGMDGYAVAEELRRDAATAGVCLIAVTGYGQEEDRRRSREAGFDYHLVKPVDIDALQQLLETVPKG